MTKLVTLCFLLAVVSSGLAVRVMVRTIQGNSVATSTISCIPGAFDSGNQAIKKISLRIRDQDRFLASVSYSNMSQFVNSVPTSNMRAHGRIDSNELDKSFLSLTFKPVLASDAGVYVCQIFYGNGTTVDTAQTTFEGAKQDDDMVIKYLMKQINSLEYGLEKKENALEKQQEHINEQRTSIIGLEKTMKEIANSLKNVQAQVMRQQTEIIAISSRERYAVAFHARYKYKYTFVRGDVLKFENVDLNIGWGYNGYTGIFTAPKTGIYTFSLTVNYPYSGDPFAVDIKANGKKVAAAYSYDEDYDNAGSTSAIVRLEAGNKVAPYIRRCDGRRNLDNDGEYSVFTGHLVKLL